MVIFRSGFIYHQEAAGFFVNGVLKSGFLTRTLTVRISSSPDSYFCCSKTQRFLRLITTMRKSHHYEEWNKLFWQRVYV